jgi:hypothetical protein
MCKSTVYGWLCNSCYNENAGEDDDNWYDIENEKLSVEIFD